MDVKTYNQKGNELKTKTRLPSDVFGLDVNHDLIYQVVNSQASNRRQGNAHSKDRSEKRGGGKKPWRQKGTGRARHGSIRSPLWVGGGVTFGPRNERNYKKRVPKKMRRKALLMVLSAKVEGGFLITLNDLKSENGKTKEVAEMIENLSKKITGEKGNLNNMLIALPEKQEKLVKAIRNIKGVDVVEARELNALDLLSYKYLLLPKTSVKVIQETFVK